jgi:hypothetical protein
MNSRRFGLLAIAAALSVLSCGDAVPPPAEGTMSITVQNSSAASNGYACGASHTITFGDAPPDASSRGTTWIGGQNGHNVTCTVKGNGTYSLEASISTSSAKSNFTINASALSVGGTNTATVSMYDSVLSYNLYDDACTIDLSGDYTIQKGAIWAAVRCNHIQSHDDNHLWCGLVGFIVFKSCNT